MARGRLEGTMAYPLRVSSPSAGWVRVVGCWAAVLAPMASSSEGGAGSAGSEGGSMELRKERLITCRSQGMPGRQGPEMLMTFGSKWAVL